MRKMWASYNIIPCNYVIFLFILFVHIYILMWWKWICTSWRCTQDRVENASQVFLSTLYIQFMPITTGNRLSVPYKYFSGQAVFQKRFTIVHNRLKPVQVKLCVDLVPIKQFKCFFSKRFSINRRSEFIQLLIFYSLGNEESIGMAPRNSHHIQA